MGHPATSGQWTQLESIDVVQTGSVEECRHDALPDFLHWLQAQDLLAQGSGWQRSSRPLSEGPSSHRPSSSRGHHHRPYRPQGMRSFPDFGSTGSLGLSSMSSGAASSVTSSLNCLPQPLETLNQLLSSSPSTLGTAFCFHSFQGLPRYGMQPSSMPPGPGLVGEKWIGCGMRAAGDLEASRNCFSPLLAVTDSASVVTHTEPHDDFDDCGLDVGQGNPDM